MLQFYPNMRSARGVLKLSPQLFNRSHYREYKNYKLSIRSIDPFKRSKIIFSAFVSGLSIAYMRRHWNTADIPQNEEYIMSLSDKILQYLCKNDFVVHAQNSTVSTVGMPFVFDDELAEPKNRPDPIEVMKKYTAEACAAYDKAIKALDKYSTRVETIMNRCPDGCIDQEPWEEIENLANEKFEAESRVKEIVRRIDTTFGPDAENARASLEMKRKKYQIERERAEVTSKYWFRVTKGRETFVAEMEALFPNTQVLKGILCGCGGDIDALLLIALRKICQLQNEISKVDCDLHSKLNRCLENSTECKAIQDRIDCELKKERAELEVYYKKKMREACAAIQNEMSTKLRTAEIDYEKCLHRTLEEQTHKVLTEERKKEAEYTATHRLMMEQKMKIVLDRLKELDFALQARSDADKMSQQAQKLWIATEVLDETLKGRSVRSKDVRTCVGKELDAIKDSAADTDELVKAVLGGVSATVRSKGVLSETVLRERFKTVEKACRDFALAPQGAKGLPQIVLSRLASCIVVRPKLSPLAPKTDDNLDNYELIEKVKKYVEEGQWDRVYHYMKLMKGGAHDVSKDWLTEVTLHLQVRLASDAIQAHAAAMGLLRQ